MITPLRALRLPLFAGLLGGIAFACGSSDDPSGAGGHSGSSGGAGKSGAGMSGRSNGGKGGSPNAGRGGTGGAGTGGRQGAPGGEAGVTGDTGGRAPGGTGGDAAGSGGDGAGMGPGAGGSTGGNAGAGAGGDAGEAGGASECAIGALSCACTLGGGCDPDLTCELGHCTDCPTGHEGCACTQGGGCDGVLLCTAASLCAAPQFLRNDSWEPAGTLNYQSGFEAGEQAAAVLGPATVASTLKNVTLAFGGAAGTSTITLSVYLEDGNATPGTPLYTGDFQITAADDALSLLDVSTEGIAVPEGGSLRVAITFDHTGTPGIAADSDGIETGRNYIQTGGTWSLAESLGASHDYVIRVELTPS